MKKLKVVPAVVWGALMGASALYEIYGLVTKTKGDTLSELVWTATDYTPLTPLVIGIIVGHWFWPRRKDLDI